MKTIVPGLAVAAAVLAAATTVAASDRLSEAAYLKAARCQGLAHAAALGPVDTTGIDAVMKVQAQGRDVRLRNQARVARAEAQESAANPANRSRLVQERDTRCAAWVSSQALANSSGPAAR